MVEQLERINILILSDKATDQSAYKLRQSFAYDTNRVQTVTVVSIPSFNKDGLKWQRPHAVIVMDNGDSSTSLLESFSKYEIKVYCLANDDARESYSQNLDGGKDLIGFKYLTEAEFDEMHSYIIGLYDSKIKQIKEIFERFDEDQNGELETTELCAVFKYLNLNIKDEDLAYCVRDIDVDGGGTVSV